MKRIIWAALSACLVLTACEMSRPDGDWNPMEWSHPKYLSARLDGVNYYIVPAEGGTFDFRCKNYTPWLGDHLFEVNGNVWHSYDQRTEEDIWHHYANEWCRIDAKEDSVTIVFDTNTGSVRKARIGVTGGDIFDNFNFYQMGMQD